MLYFHKELKEKYKYDYNIQKAVNNKDIFKIEDGLYSDKEYVNPLEIISKKYPNAILASDSAFYYHNLTDVVPDCFYLATSRSSTRINNPNIKQLFVPDELLNIGKEEMKIENTMVNIYNKERMLIELIRKKNQIPFDYYKEIISNYRKIIDVLDIYKLDEYIKYFNGEHNLYDTLQREVF